MVDRREHVTRLTLSACPPSPRSAARSPTKERAPAVLPDHHDLLEPPAGALAARIEQMHRGDHALLEHPIDVRLAVGRGLLEVSMYDSPSLWKKLTAAPALGRIAPSRSVATAAVAAANRVLRPRQAGPPQMAESRTCRASAALTLSTYPSPLGLDWPWPTVHALLTGPRSTQRP